MKVMFTGIVEEMGSVRSIDTRDGGARLVVSAATVLDDAGIGDSIAVNGCCLTVVELGPDSWAASRENRDHPAVPGRPRVTGRFLGARRCPGVLMPNTVHGYSSHGYYLASVNDSCCPVPGVRKGRE